MTCNSQRIARESRELWVASCTDCHATPPQSHHIRFVAHRSPADFLSTNTKNVYHLTRAKSTKPYRTRLRNKKTRKIHTHTTHTNNMDADRGGGGRIVGCLWHIQLEMYRFLFDKQFNIRQVRGSVSFQRFQWYGWCLFSWPRTNTHTYKHVTRFTREIRTNVWQVAAFVSFLDKAIETRHTYTHVCHTIAICDVLWVCVCVSGWIGGGLRMDGGGDDGDEDGDDDEEEDHVE